MYQAWIINKEELENIAAKHFNAPTRRGIYFTDFAVSNIGVCDSEDEYNDEGWFFHCMNEDGLVPSEEIPFVIHQLAKAEVIPHGRYMVIW